MQTPAHARPLRVLLVEDDPEVSTGLEMLLELDGREVVATASGAAVATMISRHQPDVLILDLDLPDVPGAVVARRIRSAWPNLPIIVSTGTQPAEQLADFLNQPKVFCLQKPYSIEELEAIIGKCVPEN